MNQTDQIRSAIREIPDFPQKGVLFRDITTLLKQPEMLHLTADALYEHYKNKGITKVVGVESRGFLFGSILAYRLNAGFVPIRKKGKLPAETAAKTYDLEYGTDTIEIHKDALSSDDVVLLHDDLLATGGTINAAIELVESLNVKNIYINFLCELSDLKGREKLPQKYEVSAVVKY